ncbi:MAG: reductive dehalogenase [Chloroflexales bacterium]|nr:reductive dehalogenase [Chloroflexales bacterium]
MAEKNGINRRDFLKIGGITASVFGAASIFEVVKQGGGVAADDAGGFYIRSHDPDDPPYAVDDAVYDRKSGGDTSFIRNPDKLLTRNENTRKNLESGEVGDDWLAYAYAAGAATFMFDQDMYSWDRQATNPSRMPEGRWIPEEHGYTVEDVSKIVKRSAKLYGASLVGIAPLDERWFYKDYGDISPAAMFGGSSPPEGKTPPQEMDPAQVQEMLPEMLGDMEPEALKEMLMGVMEQVDPAVLPDGINPDMLTNMPAAMLQQMLPRMMENMDPAMMSALMENMDPSMMPDRPAMMDGAMDIGTMDFSAIIQGRLRDIRFSDEIDAPVIEDDGTKIIPRSMNRVVVMAFEMDEGSINTGGNIHVVSQLGEAAAMNGYSRMAFTSACLANFIHRLGYNAIPMGNDHSLSIPMAVDAGLGELGRHGLLITTKYGPRVRLAKVLTDLPLLTDRPISFGVTEFCAVCGKCAEQCPGSAISNGGRTYEASVTGIPGLYSWPVDGDKCFGYWAEVGGSCYNCIRVCPFNKPEGWLHEATRILIGVQSGPLNQLLLKLDDAAGYGSESGDDPRDFWDKDTYIHIKA